jgi:hypothetical protein
MVQHSAEAQSAKAVVEARARALVATLSAARNVLIEALEKHGLGIGLLLIIFGIIYDHRGAGIKINDVGLDVDEVASILKELGVAFIISQIVGHFLDLKSRERYDQHIIAMHRQLAESIYVYLYQVDLPSEVFDIIERDFFHAEFIRRAMRVNYNIYEIREDHLDDHISPERRAELLSDYLIFDIHLTYKVQNLKKKTVNFPGYFAVELDSLILKPAGQRDLKLKMGLLGLYIDKKIFTDDELAQLEQRVGDELRYRFDFDIEPEQSKYVSLTHRFIKRKRDKEIYKVNHICDGIDISVHYPKSIKLHIEAVSSEQSRRRRQDASLADQKPLRISPTVYNVDDGVAQFIVEEPLFPANGVYMWWEAI